MIDIYLHAPTRADLTTALGLVGLATDGDLVQASHTHALAVVSDDADGVTVAVRCDEALAGALRATSLDEVPRPAGWAWAGG